MVQLVAQQTLDLRVLGSSPSLADLNYITNYNMNDRINTFMRDCAWIRAALYFFIAAIPAFITDLSQYKSFTEISGVALTIIIANFILQGLIAVRAFIDQSISRTQKEKKDHKKVELLNG